MGFFTGVSGITRDNSGAKSDWFRDGKYLVEINKLEARNKRADGQPIAIVEAYIVEVLVGTNSSNAEGDKVAWFNDLSRKPDNELTESGARGLKRIKTFIAELLGGDSKGVKDEDITEEVCDQLFGAADGYTGEETKGVRMVAEARTKVSSSSNKPFTSVYWSSAN